MALPPVPVPAFPDVPPLPGVPPLPRNPLLLPAAPVITRLLTDVSAVARLLGIRSTPSWGIWDTNGRTPVIIGDSVLATDLEAEYVISDAPIEQGQFESYNRVRRPKEGVVTISKGGSASSRAAFLVSVENAVDSTTLYSVVMPEKVYKNFNLVRWNFARSQDKGSQLLIVEIHVREIISTAAVAFSTTKDSASAGETNTGPVQAQPPSTAQQAGLGGAAQ